MALAPFFSRAYSAVGAHLGITREELSVALSGNLVGIHLGKSCVVEGNEKWISELLVNILARLYPMLSVSGNDDAIENISKIALSINPDIEIVVRPEEATVVVCVGETTKMHNGFTATASGWVARVGKSIECNLPGVSPYSAGASAALAAWRVFYTLFTNHAASGKIIPDISLSLLDFGTHSGEGESLPVMNLGEVAMMGIGAVGNPAIWAWAKHPGLGGKLHLIDPDNIELSNLQRYCLPFYKDIGMGKVNLSERELMNSNITCNPWPCSLEDFAKNYDGIANLPSICVSVDNIEGRRAAQALLPRLLVNGWTSDNGLGTSWHRFLGHSACLGCLYHPKGIGLSQTEVAAHALGIPHEQLANLWVKEQPLEADVIIIIENHLGLPNGKLCEWTGKRVQDVYSGVICGQVGLDLPGIGRVTTVPLAHQSILSGILMSAEIVKRSDPAIANRSQSEPLIIWDDIMRMPPKYWTGLRAKHSECFCNDQDYIDIFMKKWD